jgi:hypothetical protein
MAKSRGKDFETIFYNQIIQQCDDVSIDRFYDTMGGFYGVSNICDFVSYQCPYQFYFELKALKGNTLNFKSDIRKNQWDGLLEKSKIAGVAAGIIAWFIDNDITGFIPIQTLEKLKNDGFKSYHVDFMKFTAQQEIDKVVIVKGKKKRIYFDYDFKDFMERMKNNAKKDAFDRDWK